MKVKISTSELEMLVVKQLDHFFLDIDSTAIKAHLGTTLQRLEKCLQATCNKYYYIEDELVFNPYHSGQYSIFLYYLANTIYRSGFTGDITDKIYYLNKIMNSVDWYYQIVLPDIFSVEHPLGSVLGRAKYSDKFFIYQGVTVGGNKGCYPTIGENVIMYSNSTVVGDSHIGNNVAISSGSYIKDEVIPDNSIVFGQSPNLIIKTKDAIAIQPFLAKWK